MSADSTSRASRLHRVCFWVNSVLVFLLLSVLMAACLRRGFLSALHRAFGQGSSSVYHRALPAALLGARRTVKSWPVSFSQEELKKRLSPMQYHVTQERGTERWVGFLFLCMWLDGHQTFILLLLSAFTGELTYHAEEGTYHCVVCGGVLFSSRSKFDSGSGWPSFFDVLKEESVSLTDDFSYGMHRVETTCSQCGAHLGHLFDDGPKPTGKRYCINSVSLAFQPKDSSAAASAAAEAGAAGAPGSDGKTEL